MNKTKLKNLVFFTVLVPVLYCKIVARAMLEIAGLLLFLVFSPVIFAAFVYWMEKYGLDDEEDFNRKKMRHS
jgi:hypothetical protein